MKTLLVRTIDEWRDWLDQHHDSEREIWLVFHKEHTDVASIDYMDALDEALCFGGSTASSSDSTNVATHASSRRAGRTAAGRTSTGSGTEHLKPLDDCDPFHSRRSLRPTLPRRSKSIRPPGSITKDCQYLPTPVCGVDRAAKRDDTKLRRLDEVIRLLAAGKELGLK
jgi:hypothetical protein